MYNGEIYEIDGHEVYVEYEIDPGEPVSRSDPGYAAKIEVTQIIPEGAIEVEKVQEYLNDLCFGEWKNE